MLKASYGGGAGGAWHQAVPCCPLLWGSEARSRADAVISLGQGPKEQASQRPLSSRADARAGKAPRHPGPQPGRSSEEPGRPGSHLSPLPTGCVASGHAPASLADASTAPTWWGSWGPD